MSETTLRAPALHVEAATKHLGGRPVLRDVTLDVPHHALTLLAGPNGAGKSSLLRAVGGRLRLDAGTIAIDGRPAHEARRAGRLGVVPQDIALESHLSVRENLLLWARLAGLSGSAARTALQAGLEWVGLADRTDTIVQELSGGMRRRVNLLAGLLHRPGLLLLDEPTAGLDDAARGQLQILIADLRQQGVGMLLVSHDLNAFAGSCDAVAVMDEGRVLACDHPTALVRRFGSPDGDVVVTLETPPTTAQEHDLARAGFVRIESGEWSVAAGVSAMPEVEQRFETLGVAVDEVRWRRSTLQTAVTRLISHERERRR